MLTQRIKFSQTNIFAFSILLLVSIIICAGEMMEKIKCLDKEIALKDVCVGRLECATEFLTPEEIQTFKDPKIPLDKKKGIIMKAQDNTCIMVCQLKKHLRVLNEDGSMNTVELDKVLNPTFPEGAREGIKSAFAKCHEANANNFKDEKQCESYKPFKECMKKEFATICKIDTEQFFLEEMVQP